MSLLARAYAETPPFAGAGVTGVAWSVGANAHVAGGLGPSGRSVQYGSSRAIGQVCRLVQGWTSSLRRSVENPMPIFCPKSPFEPGFRPPNWWAQGIKHNFGTTLTL